jgi:hypothetical protein
VLLTDVFEGQEATVLQFPVQAVTAADLKVKNAFSTRVDSLPRLRVRTVAVGGRGFRVGRAFFAEPFS